jgi:hypothetical protein
MRVHVLPISLPNSTFLSDPTSYDSIENISVPDFCLEIFSIVGAGSVSASSMKSKNPHAPDLLSGG